MRRLAISWLGPFVALMLWAALAPAAAQQPDIAAIEKRARELLAARDYPAALAEAQKLEAAAAAQGGAQGANQARALDLQADVHAAAGRQAEAERLWRRVLEMREQSLGAAHPAVAATLNKLGNSVRIQGRFVEAEAPLKRALAIREQALGADHADVARTSRSSASCATGCKVATTRPSRSTSARWPAPRRRSGPNTRRRLVLTRLGGPVPHPGPIRRGRSPAHSAALAIREQALGANHPNVAISLTSLAAASTSARAATSGGAALPARVGDPRTRATVRATPGRGHDTQFPGCVFIERQGRYGEAESAHKRALAIREQALGASHPSVASQPHLARQRIPAARPLRGGRSRCTGAPCRSANACMARAIRTWRARSLPRRPLPIARPLRRGGSASQARAGDPRAGARHQPSGRRRRRSASLASSVSNLQRPVRRGGGARAACADGARAGPRREPSERGVFP